MKVYDLRFGNGMSLLFAMFFRICDLEIQTG
jgi:hypothetical protein